MLVDCVALPVALWTAFALRLGEWSVDIAEHWPAFVVSGLVCIPVFGWLGLYRHVIRHIGNRAMLSVLQGATITAIAVATVAYMVPLNGFPRSVPIIFWLLTLLYVSGTRFAVRGYFHWLRQRILTRKSVIIYGAGSNGVELSRLLNQQGDYQPIAFLDDDKSLQKRMIDGLYVYKPRALAKLIASTDARDVFVAVNSTEVKDRRRIIEFLEPYSLRVRLIPDLVELMSGRQTVADIRDVELEDLLGRDAVAPLPHLLQGSVRGRNVLVTGAGGSIGAELCRQIVRQSPRLLVLLDQSEFGLFEVQRNLKRLTNDEELETPVVAVLGSVTNSMLIRRTLESYHVDTIYHAAAYKHVDLVEHNVIQVDGARRRRDNDGSNGGSEAQTYSD